MTGGLSTLHGPLSLAHVAPYAVPAVLYTQINNLVVLMQASMDPSSFQVLSNLKIASTALLYSSCLGKRLRPAQWLALGILMGAAVVHGYCFVILFYLLFYFNSKASVITLTLFYTLFLQQSLTDG